MLILGCLQVLWLMKPCGGFLLISSFSLEVSLPAAPLTDGSGSSNPRVSLSAQECPAGHTVFVFPVPMLLIPLHIWELLALKTHRMHILIKKKSCALHLAFHRPLFLIITTLQWFFYLRKLLDTLNFSSVQSVYKNSSYFWAWKPNIDTKKLKLHFCHLINHEPAGSLIESMH